MHWFFVIVTWMGLAGLKSQEIPAYPNTEVECNRMREAVSDNWARQKLPDGFGNVIGTCQYGEGQEKVK